MKKQPKKTAVIPIPASKLLRAEAARLDVVWHAMPDRAQKMIEAERWAFTLCAAYLDSLGAPEKLERYIPAPTEERYLDKTTNKKEQK